MKSKRVIVVLGMHRSGTSAVTRGLRVMGVSLGDRFAGPVADVNAKGFWEDIDLNALNVEILNALGSDWHSLAPIQPGDFSLLCKHGYFLRAVDLLRQKVVNTDVFGFKDPRVAKLLPFWKEVFTHCAFEVSYIFAVRNPLSIVKSLSKRDGIEATQSYLLWLSHVIASLIATSGEKRVIVDYDRLMQSPEHEINRMAKHLDLEIDATELKTYKTEFLDPALRHTFYDLNDLSVDESCTPIVYELYSALHEVASEKVGFEDLNLQASILRWSDEFERFRSPLLLIDKLSAQRVSATQALVETEGRIAGLNEVVADREGQIAGLNQVVADREGQIAGLNEVVADREGQIAGLNQVVADREGQIAGLNQVVADREGQIASLKGTIDEIYRSNIWRLLKPVRWYGRQRQRLGSNWRARYRQLLERSRFVLRQEGVAAFFRRMAGYIGRSLRRRWAMQRIERYFPAQTARDFVPPLVTFIIPIYDRTNVLREAICSALGQSLQVFEVVLITDGSPPATLSVVEEFRADPRVRIFNYPTSSGNAVRGRNKGILEARGRYIAFLDSDDIAAPERLEVCLPLLESGQADVVYGAWRAKLDGTRQVDGLADGQVVYSPDCDLELLRKVCVPCQSTVMVRRELLLKAGFLKPCMQYREDHELWARLAYHGARFKALPHVLADLRLHAGNNELNFKGNDAHWERLLGEKYLQPGPRPKKIAFLLGCLGISGGAAVVLRHVSLLLEQGHDVFVINVSGQGDLDWFGNPAIRVFGLDQLDRCGIDNIDLLFATFWTTVEFLERIPALRKLYFVQSDERLFYDEPAVQAQVAATYRGAYEYVAIARWICDMLRDEFGQQQVHYVPNGLDLQMFYPGSPLQEKNPLRPRVLVEGPISVPFKGVADACAALWDLDCEVWIVSSSGRPEEHWRYDRSFEAVDHAQMRQIYASCDILLKMSRVESFAYPPLEAMACGCAVVLGEVRGGIEYAEDGVNVLKVAAGDINQARAAVQRLLDDKSLRERLQAAGFLTAKSWSWEASREAMEKVLENTQDDVQVTLISS